MKRGIRRDRKCKMMVRNVRGDAWHLRGARDTICELEGSRVSKRHGGCEVRGVKGKAVLSMRQEREKRRRQERKDVKERREEERLYRYCRTYRRWL
jgi:hypothetical protein